METGALTSSLDVAQVTLYAFWLFFAGLIYYLRQEDKREGYPLIRDTDGVSVVGYPPLPEPKTFLLRDGRTVSAPREEAPLGPIAGRPFNGAPGSPLIPTGNPLADNIGPSSWAERHDAPDLTAEGEPRVVPLRAVPELRVEENSTDPRGFAVFGLDRVQAGTVTDIWVDRGDLLLRFIEVGTTEGRTVLVPSALARIHGTDRKVVVESLKASQFSGIPAIRSTNQITLLEEDKVSAYVGAGSLYATPAREESFF